MKQRAGSEPVGVWLMRIPVLVFVVVVVVVVVACAGRSIGAICIPIVIGDFG